MYQAASHPARGAWIEIMDIETFVRFAQTSHPARGAWIEITVFAILRLRILSHPARGAWIEMLNTLIFPA